MVKPLIRGGKIMHRNTNNFKDSKVFNTAVSILSGGVLTVLCLLEDGERILLQNRRKKDWQGYALPGGHVERNGLVCGYGRQ